MSTALQPTTNEATGAISRKVLLVGSADLEKELDRTILWRHEVQRVFAPDSESGFQAVRAEKPNLVILEAEEQEATLSLIRRIRQDPEARSSGIAVLSRARPIDEEQIRAAGANVVFSAPVDPELWDARLGALLNVPPRRDLRIPVHLEAWTTLGPDRVPVEGLAINISVRGILLETEGPLDVGAKFDLSFNLPGSSAELRVLGQVARQAASSDGRVRSGIQFLILRGDARERIERFVASAASPLLGPPPRRVVSFRQMAERREWEAELRASDVRNAAILESVLDALVIVDHAGHIVEFNRAAERMFGATRAEVVGRRTDAFLPALAEGDLLLRTPSSSAPSTLGGRTETTGRRADGSEFPAELAITSLLLDGARLLTLCLRDLSERKRAERSVRAGARQFRALFERATDAMLVADDQGRSVEVNAAACALYGRDRQELLGHWIGDFAEPGFDFESMLKTLQEKTAAKGEFRLLRPDGEARDVELVATADFLPGSLVVLRDVTEHRLLEAQYRQAQKMEAVGRLAGGIAHDFNNLLNVITGYAELLLRKLATESAERRKVQDILKAAQKAASLTRQLLAFSRKQVLQPRIFDLNAVVADLDKMLVRLIGDDIELRTDLDPQLGRLKADPGQIEQVLMNLVVNARDAMPQGGKIRIDTRNVDLDAAYAREHVGARPGAYVQLRVSDTGLGMDAETQRHIFEPFFTTKKAGQGTGLGLAMVYGIVKQSDGYIWVNSRPGGGTTFSIYLPRVDDVPEAAGPTREAVAPARGRETILVVEDQHMLRSLIREVLEAAGYSVLDAESGEAALRIVASHPGRIDLMLTDVEMPGMSGPELARRLATPLPEMKVLYASGYTDDAVMRRGLLGSGSAFIPKPFTPADVERRIRELLDT